MKQQTALYWLVPVIATLAVLATSIGLFTPSNGSVIPFTTVREETVEVWGQGFYKSESGYRRALSSSTTLAASIVTISKRPGSGSHS